MDILHTFEVYQKQLENLRKSNHIGRPQVLRQFRKQFKSFSDEDLITLKTFLSDNDKKWFVAHLLDNLDTFPIDLLAPMLQAAVDEPDASFNNDFIKPCRRVFEYEIIQKNLLTVFLDSDDNNKIGVLKAWYWARPVVYSIKTGKQKGYSTFFWDYELKSFNEDFKENTVVFEREYQKQEAIHKKWIKIILSEFYNTTNTALKHQIAIQLPKEVKGYPEDLKAEAKTFLRDKKHLRKHNTDHPVLIDFIREIKSKKPWWKLW